MHKETLWDSVCLSLKSETTIKRVSFDNWIRPLVPLHYSEGIMLLKAQNQFAVEVLNKQYRQKLLVAIQEFDPTAEEVRFTLESSVPRPTPLQEVPSSLETVPQESPQPMISRASRKGAPRNQGHPLNSNFSFARFYAGGENEFALKSAEIVTRNPGERQFNPLYIYGGVGSGKSHLLHAIGNTLQETRPELKVLLVSADEFYYGYSTALKKKNIDEFMVTYQKADVLLVDELHRFSGREHSQLELFKLFNDFHQKNKQMVFAAHQPPEQLEGFQERLISRFQWGLAVGILSPKLETRLAILAGMIERDHLDISEEIRTYIAEQGPANVRELEGVVIRLLAQASLSGGDITMGGAKRSLKHHQVREQRKASTAGEIIRATSQYYHVGIDLIKGKERGKEVAHCRQVGMYLTRKYTGLGLKAIGHEFGNRDHSTVVHAVNSIEKKRKNDQDIADEIKAILTDLSLIS